MAICPGRALSLQLAARLGDLVCACAVWCAHWVSCGGVSRWWTGGGQQRQAIKPQDTVHGGKAPQPPDFGRIRVSSRVRIIIFSGVLTSSRVDLDAVLELLCRSFMASWVDATWTETSETSKLGCKLHMQRSPRRPTQRCGSAVKCVLSRPRRHTQKLLSRHQRVRRCPSCHTSRGADLPGTLTVGRQSKQASFARIEQTKWEKT